MRPSPEVHDALACLLSYPCEGGTGMLYPAATERLSRALPELADDLRLFTAGVSELDAGQLEELYTRTFDNVADRSLEIGWQLFGENYARGALMVRLRVLLRENGVPERTELPDHLTHVLSLVGRAPAPLASALACGHATQAVDKVLAALRSYGSPWVGVLEATRKVLGMHRVDDPPRGAPPVPSVASEMAR